MQERRLLHVIDIHQRNIADKLFGFVFYYKEHFLPISFFIRIRNPLSQTQYNRNRFIPYSHTVYAHIDKG